MVLKHANISWCTGEPKCILVLFISGLFRLTASQPVKSHEPCQQILDVNFVQHVASSRSIVTPVQNQQPPALGAKVCLSN